MILSMTGYSSQEYNTSGGVLLLELRSVNHRYLELQLKLDDNLRMWKILCGCFCVLGNLLQHAVIKVWRAICGVISYQTKPTINLATA